MASRRPEVAAAQLGELAETFVPLSAPELGAADVVISTLPGHADSDIELPAVLHGVPLLDVAYDPWPTALGARWLAAGGRLLHGLDMLIEQALLQVRVFTDNDPDEPLPQEDELRAAMRRAVGR